MRRGGFPFGVMIVNEEEKPALRFFFSLLPSRFGYVIMKLRCGEVAEWSNAPDSKSG
jgi:hypothetical protein